MLPSDAIDWVSLGLKEIVNHISYSGKQTRERHPGELLRSLSSFLAMARRERTTFVSQQVIGLLSERAHRCIEAEVAVSAAGVGGMQGLERENKGVERERIGRGV